MGTTDPRVEVITELRKQTALLTLIQANMTAMAGTLLDMADKSASGVPAAPTVPDRVLDGPRGDPEVKQKDPRDWSGDSMKGKRFSECSPDYLDLLADRYDYFASKEEDAKKAGYNRLDAQRARGWAAKIRGGWTPPVQAELVHEADSEPSW